MFLILSLRCLTREVSLLNPSLVNWSSILIWMTIPLYDFIVFVLLSRFATAAKVRTSVRSVGSSWPMLPPFWRIFSPKSSDSNTFSSSIQDVAESTSGCAIVALACSQIRSEATSLTMWPSRLPSQRSAILSGRPCFRREWLVVWLPGRCSRSLRTVWSSRRKMEDRMCFDLIPRWWRPPKIRDSLQKKWFCSRVKANGSLCCCNASKANISRKSMKSSLKTVSWRLRRSGTESETHWKM